MDSTLEKMMCQIASLTLGMILYHFVSRTSSIVSTELRWPGRGLFSD
jgi:hypothetical protein